MPVITVTQLNRYLSSRVSEDTHLRRFLLRGEITEFTRAASGHCYFTLKDEQSIISAVMYRNAAERLQFRPERGMTVIVSAGLKIYEAKGIYQLNVTDIQPEGVGTAALALEQRRQRLQQAGYFDRKRPLPALPHVVGLVTSGTGAAVGDFTRNLELRCPLVKVRLFPVQVEGAGAAEGVARALQFAGTQGCDVLILTRGGGGADTLETFNAECVAHAIFQSPVPVVSAVGHERDVTIADLVADVRASTPTAAVNAVVPEMASLHEKISIAERQLKNTYLALIARKQNALDRQTARLAEFQPSHRLRVQAEQLGRLTERLDHAMQKRLARELSRLQNAQEQLNALDPLRVLQRGYAAVYDEDDRLVTSVQQTAPGNTLHLRLADGSITVRVEDIHEL